MPVGDSPEEPSLIDQKSAGFLGGAGRIDIPGSELTKLGARYYDGGTGGFLSTDPVVGDAREPMRRVSYLYAFQNPSRFVDLDGRSVTDIVCSSTFSPVCALTKAWLAPHAENAQAYYKSIENDPNRSEIARLLVKIGDVLSSAATCENFDGSVLMLLPLPSKFWRLKGLARGESAADGAKVGAEALGTRFEPGKWLPHFEKHAGEFGYKTSVEYLKRARDLIGREGVETFTRTNGDRLYYDAARNEFAAVRRDGVLRTYFRPKSGADYWRKQIGG